jgi:hypothetical protein
MQMKKILLLTVILTSAIIATVNAQTKIKDGTVTGSSNLPNSNAILELESNNKGLLMPRVALTMTTSPSPLSAHIKGMEVYNTAQINDVDSGLYFNDGTKWVRVSSSVDSATAWLLHGNSGTTAPASVGTAVGGANFWGTTDAANLAVGVNDTVRAIFDKNGSLYGGVNTFDSSLNNSYNVVWGSNIKDSGIYSLAIGNSNILSQQSLHNVVYGYGNNISGLTQNSIIGGDANIINTLGTSAVFGDSHRTNAGGLSLVVGGNNTLDTSSYSLLYGHQSFLHGSVSTFIGGDSNAGIEADYSSIQGMQNYIDTGNTSIVAGLLNTLVNTSSSAVFGANNIDSASNCLIAGLGNVVTPSMQGATVVGTFNQPVAGTLMAVGNGTPSTQSNAITVTNTLASATATANNSTLNVNGSISASVNTVTGDYTFTNSDYLIIYAGTSAVNFTLPDPTTCKGRIYRVVNIGANGGSDVRITFNYPIRIQNDFGSPGSGTATTLNSSQSVAVGGNGVADSDLGNNCTIISDGTQWLRIGI